MYILNGNAWTRNTLANILQSKTHLQRETLDKRWTFNLSGKLVIAQCGKITRATTSVFGARSATWKLARRLIANTPWRKLPR